MRFTQTSDVVDLCLKRIIYYFTTIEKKKILLLRIDPYWAVGGSREGGGRGWRLGPTGQDGHSEGWREVEGFFLYAEVIAGRAS